MTLNTRDFQLFMKRLRKSQKSKIRYYLAGEYGETRERPHYHIIIFNIEDITQIHKAWTLGTIDIGQVSGASIAYTAKYIDKQKKIPKHQNDDRKREFSLQSKGLGDSFLTKQMIAYYQNDLSRYNCILPSGVIIPMPRYYRKKIFTDAQIVYQTKLIQQIVIDQDQLNEDSFNKKYPNQKLDYEQYKEIQKHSRYNKFYKSARIRE